MYTYLLELQTRPDGVINIITNGYSSLQLGMAMYYDRASKACASKQFVKVALTLQDANGTIYLNNCFNTLYEEDENAVQQSDV